MVELESDGDDPRADSLPVSHVATAAQRKALAMIQARGTYPAKASPLPWVGYALHIGIFCPGTSNATSAAELMAVALAWWMLFGL